jgi:A/G-specific adenine glycosylase
VLVAEVMLQQTQVERVVPKWHAWLGRFPTLAALAAASRADAVRAWQGLGYNLRAVRLHAIARQVVDAHAGQLPRSRDGLLRLKGIGRYTAAAVACFAFGEPVAMIDTNVRRVLERVFAPTGPVEQLAEAVLPREAAYAWNQALMDLGATVCHARRPTCLLCPLRDICLAAGRLDDQVIGPIRRSDEHRAAQERARRGALVDRLRALSVGSSLSLAELPPDSGLRRRVARLVTDGLVVSESDQLRLAD